MEGHRPAGRHPHRAAQHPPRPRRRAGLRGAEDPPQPALPLPLLAALQEHKAAQLGERMLAGSEGHDEDLVFAQANGRSQEVPTTTTGPACSRRPASATSVCTTADTPPRRWC